jgi:hypothetical protein
MQVQAAALLERIRRFRVDAERLCATITPSASANSLQRQLSSAATAVDTSYAAACDVWGERFVLHISAAARHAKRARVRLQDLAHLDHVTLEAARALLPEARAIEAILTASRNTARRRLKTRCAVEAGGRFAKSPS